MKRALLAGCAAVVGLALAGTAGRAADQAAIDKAIARGVEYLRGAPALTPNEVIEVKQQPNGVVALNGLTLLECGVAPDDKAVRRAAEILRPASVTMNETYSLALTLLFLDRLGDPADEPLIQSLTVRLLAGQNAAGGWSYNCPNIPESEVRRLTAHVQQQTTLIGRPEPPKDGEPDKDAPSPKRTVKDLPKEIRTQLALINRVQAVADAPVGGFGDNSNTQFATVALWVARRHGLPVDEALARIDRRYRTTQNADGGWAYTPGFGPSMMYMSHSSATMTCAGLLGLAVAQGAKAAVAEDKGKDGPDLEKDKALKTALEALGTVIGTPADRTNYGTPTPGGAQAGGKTYYFLWSLERVAVAFDLDTIGGKDWYAWGCDVALPSQMADGSWAGEYPAQVDTCFALLFLRRANLTRDLSAHLKGKVKDPGERTLKSGGVGGDALTRVGDLQPGVEPKDKPKGAGETKPPPAPAADETDGGRMARELAQADAGRRGELLQHYRDGKGVTYTEALAGAIPRLSGDDKKQARDALAERLTRMKADTLSRYFQDNDAEIRRAAALAAAMKGAKTLIPDLIPLLSDPEEAVAHAALAALKDMSGQDLGPSQEEWKAWWKNRDR